MSTYTQTQNTEPWSKTIKRRRLNWVGHLYRLPKETPARQALAEYQRKTKHPVGRPKPTWVALTQKELTTLGGWCVSGFRVGFWRFEAKIAKSCDVTHWFCVWIFVIFKIVLQESYRCVTQFYFRIEWRHVFSSHGFFKVWVTHPRKMFSLVNYEAICYTQKPMGADFRGWFQQPEIVIFPTVGVYKSILHRFLRWIQVAYFSVTRRSFTP